MKRGEKPQEGVRQLVINLAGKNPRPTNEAIVEKVKEKFGVPIDEKTIRRYCAKANVPTSSRKTKNHDDKAIPSAHIDYLQSIRQEASLEHVQRLLKTAEDLYSQIVLPPPDNAGSWIRPTKTTVINWTGSIIWPGSPRNHIMVLEHGYFKWVQTGASGGTLILAVEDMDPYLPYLKSHMPDKKLWRDFGRWKSDVVKYFMLCRELVETIIYISEQRTGAEIVNPYEVLAEGLDWGFVSNIYRMSTAKYGVDAGRMSEFRQYGIYPWTYRDCGLRELGYQGPLMPTLVPIGYHHDNDVLEKWRAIHCELVTTKPFEEQAEKLGIEYQRLTEIAGSIRQPIGVEIERKVFDRGRCPACP